MNNTNLACFFSKFIVNQLPSVIKLVIFGWTTMRLHWTKSCWSRLRWTLGASTKNIIFLTSVVNNILSLPPQPSSQKFADVLKTSLTNCTSKIPLSVCSCSIVCCMPSLPALVVACKQTKNSQNCKNPTSPPIIGFTCCSFLLRTFLGRNGQSSKNHD